MLVCCNATPAESSLKVAAVHRLAVERESHVSGRSSARGVRPVFLPLCCLAALLVLPLAACRTLTGQGPVPRSVATCRQLSQQGRTALDRGEWERAESLFRQATDACPLDTEARRNYAETLWHRGAGQDAVRQLVEAWKYDAHDPLLAVRAGEMYLAMGQVALARQAAGQALELDYKLASAWMLRGKTFQAGDKPRDALADFHRALGYAPGSPPVLLELAETYRKLNQPERALAALENLIDTYPPGEETQHALDLQGLALARLGRYAEAAESYNLAAQRGRPTAELLCRLAEAEWRCGRQQQARLAAENALALDPEHQPSQGVLARIDFAESRSGRLVR